MSQQNGRSHHIYFDAKNVAVSKKRWPHQKRPNRRTLNCRHSVTSRYNISITPSSQQQQSQTTWVQRLMSVKLSNLYTLSTLSTLSVCRPLPTLLTPVYLSILPTCRPVYPVEPLYFVDPVYLSTLSTCLLVFPVDPANFVNPVNLVYLSISPPNVKVLKCLFAVFTGHVYVKT